MRSASSVVTVKHRLSIDRLRRRTIVSTAPIVTTTTLHHAATSVDTSSVQVSFTVSQLPASSEVVSWPGLFAPH